MDSSKHRPAGDVASETRASFPGRKSLGGFRASSPASRASFTLVEMLVAVAVLAALMLLVAKLTGAASRMSDVTNRHADASGEAREILDRLGVDVAAMVLRPDVDAVFAKETGNDALFFYSRVPGYFLPSETNSQSPVSLVGYRISTQGEPTGAFPGLQRLSRGVTWDGQNSMAFLASVPALSGDTSTIPLHWPDDVGTSPYQQDSAFFHTIGSQVFRLEFCLQLQIESGGQYSYAYCAQDIKLNADLPTSSATGGLPLFNPYPSASGTTNVTALVVSIAVLDPHSRSQLATLDPNLTKITQALPDLTDIGTQTPEEIWNAKLLAPGFAGTAGIPAALASQIRVFQRTYPLHIPLPQ